MNFIFISLGPDIASKSIKVKSSETKPSKEKEPAEPIGRPASLSSRKYYSNLKFHILTSCY